MRKLVRSILVRLPRLYERLGAQWRYRLYHRLGVVHEREFRALPLLVDRADPLVLDVGANNGQSILSVKTVLPAARVASFEPSVRHRRDLERLAQRLGDVRIETCALGEEEGESELFWPVYRGMAMHALATLDPSEVMSWLGARGIYGYEPDQLHVESERVPVRTLDSLGLAPDVLKLDVQGTEAKVLAGALATIERTRPVVMAEELQEDDDACRLLKPLGYDVFTFRRGRLERGTAGRAKNRFLVPAERVPQAAKR